MMAQSGPRMPSEYRHMSSGSLNIPQPTDRNSAGGAPPVGGMGRFEGPRSPPQRQNTSHVPCKFFRQGACQAGSACPFSHDLASTNDNVCKYFAKGNCKFGPKCANIHVLPDGRRVNYKHGAPMGNGHLNIGGRLNTDLYHPPNSGSTLTNAFVRAGNNGLPGSSFGPDYPYRNLESDQYPALIGRHQSVDINIPIIDTTYTSRPVSQYGSPRDGDTDRFGFGLSPAAAKGCLDAPLPASFDSNGVSTNYRYGPVASSVPAKFGLDSPPGSLGAAKDGRTSEALKNLHSSAFGDGTRDAFNGVAGSPPAIPAGDYFGKREMHSQRIAKSRIMSASLPKHSDQNWTALDENESTFTMEEDEFMMIPEGITSDVLTDTERARRGSRTADDGGRSLHSGTGTPNGDGLSKFGSPSNASPSRFSPLFQRQKQEEEDRVRSSAFGHVGSPLRNSSLHPGVGSNSIRPIVRNSSGDSSSYLSSPPRQTVNPQISTLSQALQRTRLSSRADSTSSDGGLHPSRAVSTPIGSIGSGLRATAERQVSSSSLSNGGSGRFTTPIDEEEGGVFNMEGDDSEESREKRNSGGWTYAGGRSPHLGARNGPSTSNGNGTSFRTMLLLTTKRIDSDSDAVRKRMRTSHTHIRKIGV